MTSHLDTPVLDFRTISKYFLRDKRLVEAVRQLNLTVKQGEFVCLVGPSGCGKSTLLNMAAGIMPATMGEVHFRGKPVPTPNTEVGYITQSDNLLPWKTVTGNIMLPLKFRNIDRDEARDKVRNVIDLVGLTGFEEAYPRELSGGMRKRVTLARTLVYEPDVILADEPFGALDAQLKHVLAGEMLRICETTNTTILFVTHDIAEAVILADRVIVMSARPARIIDDCPIDIARPRDVATIRNDPGFGIAYQRIWDNLAEFITRGESI